MKKLITGLTILACTGVVQLDAKTVFGPATYSDKSVKESLKIMGPLTADKFTAQEEVKVHGPATLKDSTIHSIEIMGPLTAKNTTFASFVTAQGNVTAQGSTFKELLETSGNSVLVELEDTQAKDITVNVQETGTKKTKGGYISSFFYSSKKDEEGTRVVLKGNTVVDGTITFVGGKGKVIIEGNAKHTGTVIGAKEDTK